MAVRQLRHIRAVLGDRPVHILGSGPDGVTPQPEEAVICANLSATSPVLDGRTPDITVIDFEATTRQGREKVGRREFQTALQGRRIGHLIIAQSNGAICGRVSDLGAIVDSVTILYSPARNRLLRRATGLRSMGSSPSSMPSTGATAIALAAACGASSIQLSGIGLLKPNGLQTAEHFYLVSGEPEFESGRLGSATPSSMIPRSHSAADALLISILAASGFPIRSDNPTIEPLCMNWGPEPPRWALHPVSPVTSPVSLRQRVRALRWALSARVGTRRSS